MKWETDSKGSPINYIGHARTSPLTEVVQELWREYLDDAPINANVVWDHLRVEIWLDSGRVILFPTTSPFLHRVEKAMCQRVCSDLFAFYESLIEAGLSDEMFEAALNRKEQEVANVVSSAAEEAGLPKRLGRREVRIFYYGSNLEKPVKEQMLSAF